MKLYRLEVFPPNNPTTLRLVPPAPAPIKERTLTTAEIDDLIEDVEANYRTTAPQLEELGQRLYDWLDGQERWFEEPRSKGQSIELRLEVNARLRHLPWELLYAHKIFLTRDGVNPWVPVRRVIERNEPQEAKNRPLRVLFMASSPLNTSPVLKFEEEERKILEATKGKQIELVVEERGSSRGLKALIQSFDPGYFDVFHLTGHADVQEGKPVFYLEDDQGALSTTTAEQLAQALEGRWPRLVFLSGCRTAQAPDEGSVPSFSEELVRAGAPAVLGWALPVEDTASSIASGALYEQLASAQDVKLAVITAKRKLQEQQALCWHLLRLYSDDTPLEPYVTPTNKPGRERVKVRRADQEFLDAGSKTEVCPRTLFVGRRRILQRCLKVLRSQQDQEDIYAEGIVLHGMGGLGKSSTAARLCERMTEHKRMICAGPLDEIVLLRVLGDKLSNPQAIQNVNQPGLSLRRRLVLLLEDTSVPPALFVFDDFEQNIEKAKDSDAPQPDSQGQYKIDPKARKVLHALLQAIRETNSNSRVIITSRYRFPALAGVKLWEEGLEGLRGADLDKKCDNLEAIKKLSKINEEQKKKALTLSAGNPRLLERLEKVAADPKIEMDALLSKLEVTTEEFREEILLEELLHQQGSDGQKLLAFLALYREPIPREAIEVSIDSSRLIEHLEQAIFSGLIEAGLEPGTTTAQYFVSTLLVPLLANQLTEEEKKTAQSNGAKYLYNAWREESTQLTIDRGQEIHRLALQSEEKEILATITKELSAYFIKTFRYQEAILICNQTLSIIDDIDISILLAKAQLTTGKTNQAQLTIEKALDLCPEKEIYKEKEANDRILVLRKLAEIFSVQGKTTEAIELWEQSLLLTNSINDMESKAAIFSDMSYIIEKQGNTKKALELLHNSLEIISTTENLDNKASLLNNIARITAKLGNTKKAFKLWEESLELNKKNNDIQGEAVILHNMSQVYAEQGDTKKSLEFLQKALELKEITGDLKSKSTTISYIANILARKGNITEAFKLWEQAIDINNKTGDLEGKSNILASMAAIFASQGETKKAFELWEQALTIDEKTENLEGKAVILGNMSTFIAREGNIPKAFELANQALSISEQSENIATQATALNQIGYLSSEQGELEKALDYFYKSISLNKKLNHIENISVANMNIANIFRKQGESQKSKQYYIEAAKNLATISAWPTLIAALANIDFSTQKPPMIYLPQALWISTFIEIQLSTFIAYLDKITQTYGIKYFLSPTIAASKIFIFKRLEQKIPDGENRRKQAEKMLNDCAKVRRITTEKKFNTWIKKKKLDDPAETWMSLRNGLEELVPKNEWLFDRKQFLQSVQPKENEDA